MQQIPTGTEVTASSHGGRTHLRIVGQQTTLCGVRSIGRYQHTEVRFVTCALCRKSRKVS